MTRLGSYRSLGPGDPHTVIDLLARLMVFTILVVAALLDHGGRNSNHTDRLALESAT